MELASVTCAVSVAPLARRHNRCNAVEHFREPKYMYRVYTLTKRGQERVNVSLSHYKWPVRLLAQILPFQGGEMRSTPIRAA